jgi:NADPH:quinone reductase-like Zn-dependent oxidoreductase
MKAITQDRYGSPQVLTVQDIPTPEPGEHEVLVRVLAASANARDWHFMRGDPYLARLAAPELGVRGPHLRVRGTDFAGEVVAVGASVPGLPLGTRVFGESHGAFAEFVCADADHVATMPTNLSFAQAAALPLAANTALVALRDDAAIHSGHSVLINGASGGVGLFAVQLARHYGARVTGVCSARNAPLAQAAGADRVIDYTREDFTHSGERYDVVFDLVGNHSLGSLRRVAAPRGTVLLSGGGVSKGGSLVGPMALMIRGSLAARRSRDPRVVVVEAHPSAANLGTIRDLAEAGILRPVIDRTYALDQAAEAIGYLEGPHARAKVVLTLDDGRSEDPS